MLVCLSTVQSILLTYYRHDNGITKSLKKKPGSQCEEDQAQPAEADRELLPSESCSEAKQICSSSKANKTPNTRVHVHLIFLLGFP